MPLSIEQRRKIIELLSGREEKVVIARQVGVSIGQVSAVAAHIKMGRYGTKGDGAQSAGLPAARQAPNSLASRSAPSTASRDSSSGASQFSPLILLGQNLETGASAYWNPFPATGAPNPHVLIVGESGSGKTFAAQCLVAELAVQRIPSIVFDYAQGFDLDSLADGFRKMVSPVELNASRDGLDINPLSIFRFDVHGPINVAQRIADTFERVYPRIGVQQHSLIRDVVLEIFASKGIDGQSPATWSDEPPAFNDIWFQLQRIASDPDDPRRSLASKTHSHISTAFIFRTFREGGRKIDWDEIVGKRNDVVLIQLKGLELSTQKVVTELLLWNLIGYLENAGPSQFRVFVVLDEAHRLSFAENSPVERLLREGRKFGVGVLLASQQVADFSEVAFSNTATKLFFRISSHLAKISKVFTRGIGDSMGPAGVAQMVADLPQGTCLLVVGTLAQAVKISGFEHRVKTLTPNI